MKKLFFFLIVNLFVVTNSAIAQFKSIKKNQPPASTTSPATPTTTNVAGASTSSSVVATPQKVVAPPKNDTGIVRAQRRYDTATDPTNTRDYGVEVKPSRRNNYAYFKETITDRKPLAYENLREDDASYTQFIWREIDAREKMNLSFINSAKEEDGDQRFFSVLLNAIKNDSVVAFDPVDDRFTTPLTYDEVVALSTSKSNKLDTTYVENANDENIMDTVISWKGNLKAPKPDSVYKFRIKEQWIFDKEASRMFVRIIGIAPMAPNPLPPGQKKQVGQTTYYPMFWIYYPDLRPTLAKHYAYNPKNMNGRQTWEDVFEGRYFSSYIVKSSMNNTKDKTLAQMIKDPLFQLLEGENIKEKIFNYEQDLWSY